MDGVALDAAAAIENQHLGAGSNEALQFAQRVGAEQDPRGIAQIKGCDRVVPFKQAIATAPTPFTGPGLSPT